TDGPQAEVTRIAIATTAQLVRRMEHPLSASGKRSAGWTPPRTGLLPALRLRQLPSWISRLSQGTGDVHAIDARRRHGSFVARGCAVGRGGRAAGLVRSSLGRPAERRNPA